MDAIQDAVDSILTYSGRQLLRPIVSIRWSVILGVEPSFQDERLESHFAARRSKQSYEVFKDVREGRAT